jgi:hypothetical protein
MYTSPHHGDRPFANILIAVWYLAQGISHYRASLTSNLLPIRTPTHHPTCRLCTPHNPPTFLAYQPTPAALLCQQLQSNASDCTLVHADIAICSTTGATAYFFCLAPAPAHTLRTLSTQAGRGASGNTKEHQGAHSSARNTLCEAHALKPAPHNPQYPNTTKGKALHQQPVISALQIHASLARLLLACLSKSRAT